MMACKVRAKREEVGLKDTDDSPQWRRLHKVKLPIVNCGRSRVSNFLMMACKVRAKREEVGLEDTDDSPVLSGASYTK
jgi:hypothetical protein